MALIYFLFSAIILQVGQILELIIQKGRKSMVEFIRAYSF
jgi:hypothetical protein